MEKAKSLFGGRGHEGYEGRDNHIVSFIVDDVKSAIILCGFDLENPGSCLL